MTDTIADDGVIGRWRAARPFVAIGSICIVTGGLAAAFSGPLEFQRGSWLAAYLVLVGGVAQVALGAGQAWIADQVPLRRSTTIQVGGWNAGVAAVVVGTLASLPTLTSVGGVATAVALWMFLRGTRSTRPVRLSATLVYRFLVAIVLASIPVGLALAWMRHG